MPWGLGSSSDGFNGPVGETQQPIMHSKTNPICVVPAGTRYRLKRKLVDQFPSQTAATSNGQSGISVPRTREEYSSERSRQINSRMSVGGGDLFKIVKIPDVITEESVRITGKSAWVIPTLPVCSKGTRAQATYEELFESRDPDFKMSLGQSFVSLFKRTTGNWRVQLLATAVGPRTSSRSTFSTYRVEAVFALVTDDGTVIIGSDVGAGYIVTSMMRGSGSQPRKTNMLVSANELANTEFVLLGEMTCNWGVTIGSIVWIEDCISYWGAPMSRPPRGALSTRSIAERFVASHLAEMQSSAAKPSEKFRLAGWMVMRIR